LFGSALFASCAFVVVVDVVTIVADSRKIFDLNGVALVMQGAACFWLLIGKLRSAAIVIAMFALGSIVYHGLGGAPCGCLEVVRPLGWEAVRYAGAQGVLAVGVFALHELTNKSDSVSGIVPVGVSEKR